MSDIQKAVRQMQRAKTSMARALERLQEQIIALPDCPNIRRMSPGSCCFVIQLKDLRNSWSPDYYDFKKQYVRIASAVKDHPADLLAWWERVKQQGGIVHRHSLGPMYGLRSVEKFVLHPQVIDNVDRLIYGD